MNWDQSNNDIHSAGDALQPITVPYLLVTHIGSYKQGLERYTDRLWSKDLEEHLRYLCDLTIANPLSRGTPPPQTGPIKPPPKGHSFKFVDLSATRTVRHHILFLASDVLRIWSAVGLASIVHVGPGGWPIPMGWFAGPIAKLRRKKLVVIFESADWTIPTRKLRARMYNAINEWIAPKLARWADLAIYTQKQYMMDYPPRDPSLGHVIPASWIDEEIILTQPQADAAWSDKPKVGLKLAFFGRLVEQKGVKVLLDAMGRVLKDGKAVTLDIYGAGSLEATCKEAARLWPNQITMRGEVAYGPAFFEVLRQYHAVIVPGLATEQPRILYDANAQAVPVLCTATDGNQQVVTDGVNGRTMAVNDPEALARLILEVHDDHPSLRRMGYEGLRIAHEHTHREMHRKRWVLLQTLLSSADHSISRADDSSHATA